jgi:isopenicillin N synthase-like dioxygenase
MEDLIAGMYWNLHTKLLYGCKFEKEQELGETHGGSELNVVAVLLLLTETMLKKAINWIRSADSEEVPQPPPGPPPSSKVQQKLLRGPSIRAVDLPLILPVHRYNLAAQGWTTVTLSGSDHGAQVREASQALFAAGKRFFHREDKYKRQFATKMDSEEGWTSIPGEKEFITIRCTRGLPDELRGAATAFWAVAGQLLNDMLGGIAESLALKPDALTRLSEPCARLLAEPPTATMLRLFRYEGWEDKVVAEPHCDLGLLSLVMGSSPGLEVWNAMDQSFFPVEKAYPDLSESATVLAGRQLHRLSNGLYAPGGHLVRAYPNKPQSMGATTPGEKQYRYSIVFVLRGHYPIVIDAAALTSEITGVPTMITDGMSTKELFMSIKGAHYNINTNIEAREEQKRRIRELSSRESENQPPKPAQAGSR